MKNNLKLSLILAAVLLFDFFLVKNAYAESSTPWCCVPSTGDVCIDSNSSTGCQSGYSSKTTGTCATISGCKQYQKPATTTQNQPQQAFPYVPMEAIPGFPKTGDSTAYILQLYQFGLWTVGIAAMLMISIGAFMYITSGGNTSTMGTAKGYIVDAIAGVILALTSYILLYTINPALVQIGGNNYDTTGSNSSSNTGNNGTSTGTCTPVPGGDCTITNLQTGCFGSNAEKMSKICSVESNGNPNKCASTTDNCTDRCKDGNAFSIGLFQINMITSAGSIGCKGSDIFTVNGSGPQGTCLETVTNSSGLSYCKKRDCEVKDMAKYTECLNKLKNGQMNITAACNLPSSGSNGSNTSPWVNTANKCGL